MRPPIAWPTLGPMARAVLLLAVLLLTACAKPSGGGSPADDVVGEWELVAGTAGGAPLPQPGGTQATLTLDGAQAGGRSFCNSYSSGYTVDGASFRFEAIGGTEMGCEPAIMAAETAYVTALAAVDAFARDGADLVLTGDGVELRFRPVPPTPTSELVGTRWELDTLLDGETASSVMGRPQLLLSADGSLSGSTGCRDLAGAWTTSGDLVSVTGLAATGECPAELQAQDAHVLAVLGDGFRVEVEEDRLTVLDAVGRGLGYRAR